MRRARIKAVANVPIRRKTVQPIAKEEAKVVPPSETITKDNITENNEISQSTVPTPPSEPKSSLDEQPNNDEIPETTATSVVSPEPPKLPESEPSKDVTPPEPVAVVADKITSPPPESTEIKLPAITNETVCASPAKSIPSRSTFIRPVPRLDGHGRIRKNSIQGSGASASESEDDSRRNATINYNHTRVESTTQATENQINNGINKNSNNNNTGTSKGTLKPKRKFVISESARRMAEKRREFQLKHEDQLPDRAKLTMYDLIYYNPATNPMKQTAVKKPPPRHVEQSNEPVSEEEIVDDPAETAMPVPQVKVGPDGQLIIDEQSLVIENTGVKKSREALARQEAEVDDNNYGSGFYKRRPRSKDWPKIETIKFYKAINTVGTDFLLMQSLFPNRSRQELKLKFKKEERINRTLVEKALKNCQEYNIDALKQDLKICEDEEKAVHLRVESKAQELNNEPRKKRKRKYRRMATLSISQHGENDENPIKRPRKPPIQKIKKNIILKKKSTTIPDHLSKSEDSSVSGSEKNSEADNETDSELYKPRATRSGRKPRNKKISTNKNKILDNIYEIEENTQDDSQTIVVEDTVKVVSQKSLHDIKESIKDMGSVEPGSLVILSNESPDEPGKTVFQVYMVGSELNNGQTNLRESMTPVNLSSEMLAMVTNELCPTSSADVVGE